jgi:hypothetical protein
MRCPDRATPWRSAFRRRSRPPSPRSWRGPAGRPSRQDRRPDAGRGRRAGRGHRLADKPHQPVHRRDATVPRRGPPRSTFTVAEPGSSGTAAWRARPSGRLGGSPTAAGSTSAACLRCWMTLSVRSAPSGPTATPSGWCSSLASPKGAPSVGPRSPRPPTGLSAELVAPSGSANPRRRRRRLLFARSPCPFTTPDFPTAAGQAPQ